MGQSAVITGASPLSPAGKVLLKTRCLRAYCEVEGMLPEEKMRLPAATLARRLGDRGTSADYRKWGSGRGSVRTCALSTPRKHAALSIAPFYGLASSVSVFRLAWSP